MDYGLLLIILFILAPLLERLLGIGRARQGQPPEDGEVPPSQQRRRDRMAQQEAPGTVLGEEQEEHPFRSIPSADQEAQQAATMLPDDLWEILTGEKRAPAPRPTAQLPGPAAPTPSEPRPRSAAPAEARRADRMRREAESRQRDRVRDRERDPGSVRARERPPAPSRERRLPPVTMRSPRDAQPVPRRHTPAAPPSSPADDYVREIPIHEAPIVVSYETPPLDSDARYAQFQDRRSRMLAPATVDRGPRTVNYSFTGPEDLRRAFVMSEILGKPKALEDE